MKWYYASFLAPVQKSDLTNFWRNREILAYFDQRVHFNVFLFFYIYCSSIIDWASEIHTIFYYRMQLEMYLIEIANPATY